MSEFEFDPGQGHTPEEHNQAAIVVALIVLVAIIYVVLRVAGVQV